MCSRSFASPSPCRGARPQDEHLPMTDLIALADAHCIPRKGSEHKLTEARVRELMPQVPGWELAEDGHALVKTYKFADYYRTMACTTTGASCVSPRTMSAD